MRIMNKVETISLEGYAQDKKFRSHHAVTVNRYRMVTILGNDFALKHIRVMN